MAQEASNPYQLSFRDPRLNMTIGGRFTVRIVSYLSYLVLFALMVTFFLSGIRVFEYIAAFLLLFFLDRVIHRKQADLPISELPKPASGARERAQVNLARITSPKAFSAIDRAFDKSLVAKTDFPLALASELFDFPQIKEGLARLSVDAKEFKTRLEDAAAKTVATGKVSKNAYLGTVESLACTAFAKASENGHEFIGIGDFFTALACASDDAISSLFDFFSIEPDDMERALLFPPRSALKRWSIPKLLGGFAFDSHRRIRHRVMNRAWTSRPTPMLDRVSTDLTDLAREGQAGFLIGHREEYARLADALARPIDPNALLVGDAGIGKEAIVQHLAFRIIKDDVPKELFDKRLVSLAIQDLVSGADEAALTKRLRAIVQEIEIAGNIILYIPDIHYLLKTSGEAYLSAADILMPVIMSEAFPVIGATFPREFKEFVEPRSDFAHAFETIHVNEISEGDAEKILIFESMILERTYGIVVSFAAVKRAVMLAKKYFHEKFLPSSAEELLKTALVDAERRGESVLNADLVTTVAEGKVHIPMHEADAEESEKLLHMEELIHRRLVGQEEAVRAVSEAIREYRSGIARHGGPIASFLFVGPTGVGKTELAKTLAALQFGSEKAMVRFDMTEYQSKESFERFIGSTDGKTPGALTEAVSEHPYCLILLDEFEKAFPGVFDLFLQVFDDGRLTDNLGRTIDFTNTIIIATSNAHSDIVNESLSKGESMSGIAEYVKKRLTDVFKPELLNRFSKIIIFKDLAPQELLQIIHINLAELAETLKAEGIFVAFSDDAVKKLAQLGYDPAFGARPLRRVLDEKLRAPLSSAILAKKVKKGDHVKLVLKDDQFDYVTAQ